MYCTIYHFLYSYMESSNVVKSASQANDSVNHIPDLANRIYTLCRQNPGVETDLQETASQTKRN
ncbi:hypothetical protein Lalb_Chr10g0093371 [Lupinus albus]|uniref:Uncharacterized protein n=1 Tax=Lupinus albus TaxID=3870 RepID=A0A6A4PV02_LUPAL|nr:hypothetical protein Lalb_Chr10g0093371 [Lupinus albus]